ncbi:hypothetical protein A2861_03600 [Candidatus Roizmanbacteria bacterium RIFCSPHIGHO2_01_FULL_38_15]|nr:MAG: hypothetical protein A2861_03600 [Candidatus Roizmanbacteria bacterium RIFCSPHIGHO2_01_FULL_38_15]OGK35653.1 MAG: hypothetical protein A3F59_01815 [Candidatus Roizmanbacteria bacterium RIFCSPHIGHO2_12_FULL_38_13]
MDMNISTQQVNPSEIPVQPQPIQSHVNNQKRFFPIVLGVIILLLVVGGGAYYLGTQQNKPMSQITQQPTPIVTTPTTEISQPSQTEASVANPVANLTWKTQKISIEEETAIRGKQTINMELKLPSDWTFQTTPVASNPDNMIKNCSTYTIVSKDQAIRLTLQPICQGWAGKSSSWPTDAVIAFQRSCAGNDGAHTCYRVRYSTTSNNYNYVDAMTEPNRPLDKSKDQVQDTMIIGYTPPNDSKDDFFFIPGHLTTTYSGTANQKDNYLSVADQIAASVTLL